MALTAASTWISTIAAAQAAADASITTMAAQGLGSVRIDFHDVQVARAVRLALLAGGFTIRTDAAGMTLFASWWNK